MARIEVLAGAERRRRWSVEHKQAIVAAAFGPGAVVRDVARQADVTPSLIYRWRRDLRAAASGFAQVLLTPAGNGAYRLWRQSRSSSPRTPVCGSRFRCRLLWRPLSLRHWRGDDPGSLCGSGVAGGRPNRHRKGMNGLALQVQQGLGRDPHAGDLYAFRGARGDLIKIVWHDGIGMSLYAKRLDRGRFIWPSPADGIVAITAAQLAYMLDGIDWRNPVRTWRPEVAG